MEINQGHFHLGQIYNSEHNIHLGDKLWRKQHYSALNVYERRGAKSVKILENILDCLTNSQTKQLKSYQSLPFYQLGYY